MVQTAKFVTRIPVIVYTAVQLDIGDVPVLTLVVMVAMMNSVILHQGHVLRVARMGPGEAGVKRHVVKAARAVHVTELLVIV